MVTDLATIPTDRGSSAARAPGQRRCGRRSAGGRWCAEFYLTVGGVTPLGSADVELYSDKRLHMRIYNLSRPYLTIIKVSAAFVRQYIDGQPPKYDNPWRVSRPYMTI